jgi:AraC-like DNA-binding protein
LIHRRVKIGQAGPSLKETHFENQRLARPGVEVISFSHLCSRTTKKALYRPERVHFYMLMFITSGSGEHSVDHLTAPISAGSLILVRPGQVQNWHAREKYAAEIVLFDPAALRPTVTPLAAFASLDGCPAFSRVPYLSRAKTLHELAVLRSEIRRYDGSELTTALIRQLLQVLLLRVTRWCKTGADRRIDTEPGQSAHQLFLRALEAEYRKQHHVYYYARRLGYSVSTLNRRCALAEGRSAKVVIDRRIALEARRLLIHSGASYAEIGHHLGFSETTNFVKFFTRVVGHKPAAFRRDPSMH